MPTDRLDPSHPERAPHALPGALPSTLSGALRPAPHSALPRALPDATAVARTRAAHERFVGTGAVSVGVRAVVAESWRRSLRSGVDPERPAPPVALTDADLHAYRDEHPLRHALPVVRGLLLDAAVTEGFLVALTDVDGRLLWIAGDAAVRRAVEGVGFVEGAAWDERHAGTNAPGTALATGSAVQVLAAEHFTRAVQPWSCTAAVLRDPGGRTLGALDVTGREAAASPLMLSLVRATAAAVEAELRARDLARAPGAGDLGARPRLDVLGARSGVLHRPGAPAHPLSLRHAELLLLLAEHPRGLHADELAVLLHPEAMSDVAVRAEVSRLRRTAGPLVAHSRPYRLAAALTTDAAAVRDALAAGDVRGALDRYPGPVLPRSRAPGVEQVRDALTSDVRAAVLHATDPGVLERWLDHDEGAEDWQAWERLAALSAPGSAAATRAEGRLDLLVRRLGGTSGPYGWR
ncbi:GAF domain-containing protein [Cellulomonas triticagri]|uniref:Transcriptional regulator n=1 Tax=Cellulomonas triticagri TaxID=2483352 RepID=A0A3M2J7E1_9CELL|nr:GAF domain-containing protein [Cellulomonas triticagri]RMI09369.1 transcriptional regulator [Cellulomonas triticagri]